MPLSMSDKKTKTVLCLRNPKDTAISHFHHLRGFRGYEYNGKIENFIRPWVDGKCKSVFAKKIVLFIQNTNCKCEIRYHDFSYSPSKLQSV